MGLKEKRVGFGPIWQKRLSNRGTTIEIRSMPPFFSGDEIRWKRLTQEIERGPRSIDLSRTERSISPSKEEVSLLKDDSNRFKFSGG